MTRVVLIQVAATLLVLGGCSTDEGGQHAGSGPIEKQRQTWSKPYSETTCDDWHDKMTDAQRWTASADLLMARRKGDSVISLPSKDQVAGFEEGLTSSCTVPDPIDAVAEAVYRTDPTTFSE